MLILVVFRQINHSKIRFMLFSIIISFNPLSLDIEKSVKHSSNYFVKHLLAIRKIAEHMSILAMFNTYSLAMGTEPLLFGLAIMLAWLRALIKMVEGLSLHGSPSTCIGMAFRVFNSISLHCINLSPCPPMYKVA